MTVGTTNLLLARQQHFKRQVWMGHQLWEAYQLVKKVNQAPAPGRFAALDQVTVRLDAHYPLLVRDGIDQTHRMRVKQRAQLAPDGRERSRLNLDQLTFANDVNAEAVYGHLSCAPAAGRSGAGITRISLLESTVQRGLSASSAQAVGPRP
jgi:hypothetical protein